MTRLEKCEILKERGYTYNPTNGKIYNPKGKEITGKNRDGYIVLNPKFFQGSIRMHHFAWYCVYGNVDFNMLDHINTVRTDNRISNLRIVTEQQNCFNRNIKGYSWNKNSKKWQSEIMVNAEKKYLGCFDTIQEAKRAYLEAKKMYHII
jgi:hypothetical protein